MELLASIFIIFDGDSLPHDDLRSNQMSSVLDAFDFRRIDALKVLISWMQLINLDLALMQGCSLGLDVSVSRRNFKRLGLVKMWEGLGLVLNG